MSKIHSQCKGYRTSAVHTFAVVTGQNFWPMYPNLDLTADSIELMRACLSCDRYMISGKYMSNMNGVSKKKIKTKD